MHENKNIFCFNVLTKIGYFNTRFIFLQCKNTNQYYAKLINNIWENHKFF